MTVDERLQAAIEFERKIVREHAEAMRQLDGLATHRQSRTRHDLYHMHHYTLGVLLDVERGKD